MKSRYRFENMFLVYNIFLGYSTNCALANWNGQLASSQQKTKHVNIIGSLPGYFPDTFPVSASRTPSKKLLKNAAATATSHLYGKSGSHPYKTHPHKSHPHKSHPHKSHSLKNYNPHTSYPSLTSLVTTTRPLSYLSSEARPVRRAATEKKQMVRKLRQNRKVLATRNSDSPTKYKFYATRRSKLVTRYQQV